MHLEYDQLLKANEHKAMALDQPGLLGAFYARLGGCGWWVGQHEQTIQTLNQEIALCDLAGNAEYAGFALIISKRVFP